MYMVISEGSQFEDINGSDQNLFNICIIQF